MAAKPRHLRIAIISLGSALLIFALVMVYMVNHKPAPELASVPLPALGTSPVKLRVAHVINSRFISLNDAQLAVVLNKTQALVQQHFNLQVEFDAPKSVSIEAFFALRKRAIEPSLKKAIVNPLALTEADRENMRKGIYETLGDYWDERAKVADYARPYLSVPFEGTDYYSLSNALMETLIARLGSWYSQTADDGRPILDGSPYNEWVWWDTVGYGEVPYEVVITNQLVASAEIYAMDVHSCIRGGITAGTTSYSQSARFQTYSFVSAFQMLNDNDVLDMLRDESHYSSEQVTDYVAAVLAHELGHMLLHLGHPFGSEHCIMSPTPLLRYRSWYNALDAARCPLGSEAQMTPGVAKIEYRPDW
jgi:hypothetical protein